VDNIVLKQLIENQEYLVKVLPHLRKDFFGTYSGKLIYKIIKTLVNKYHRKPTYTAIMNAVQKIDNINESAFNEVKEDLSDIQSNYDEELDFEWLMDETEQFCKDKAMENAIFSSVSIYEDKEKPNTKIEELIRDALSISFKNNIGINYFKDDDIKRRYESMTSVKKKFKSHLSEFNLVCGGGIEPKALSLLVGDTHSGKTMSMVSLGASYVRNGYNVLYVTLEMSEEKISQLFDANFIDMEINDIPSLTYDNFHSSVKSSWQDGHGDLFIREFPTAGAGTNDIRNLCNELKIKEGFEPDILIVDYVNLMRSDRYSNADSYTMIKSIAEELRGLMVDMGYAGLTATQLNRGGADSANPTMRDTAESYGLPATVDLLVAMYTNEDLQAQNVIIWKYLKNRFGGITGHKTPFTTLFEMAMLCDIKKEHDDVPFIKNSEKTIALIEKMKRRSDAGVADTCVSSDINELFDEG